MFRFSEFTASIMTHKQISKRTDILFGISTIIVILGFIFKIFELPLCNIILITGLISAALLSYKEVKRLKNVIKS